MPEENKVTHTSFLTYLYRKHRIYCIIVSNICCLTLFITFHASMKKIKKKYFELKKNCTTKNFIEKVLIIISIFSKPIPS